MAAAPWFGVEWTNSGPRFLWSGPETASGVSVDGNSALKTIAVQRCVALISGTLAKSPIYGYEPGTQRSYRPSEVEQLFNRRANPNRTGFAYRAYLWQQVLLWGNHYALKVRNSRGQLIALWPLDAATIELRIDNQGTVTFRRYLSDGRYEDYQQRDIFHVPYIITDEHGRGLSVIQAHAQAIGINQAAELDAAGWFKRGARLSGLLKHPGKLNDDSFRRLREAWAEQYSGTENSHKAAILEEGMDFVPVTMKPADKQLLETRIQSDEQVCMMFGVPPSMIGLTAKSTSWGTGIAEQGLGWQKFTIGTLATGLESEAQRQLLDDDTDLRHDFSELLKPDFKTLVSALKEAHQGGLMTANECRDLIDYDPRPDGNELIVQQQMVPISRAGDQLSTGGTDAPNPTV